MPSRLPKPCASPGCPELVTDGSKCEKHKKQQTKQYDKQRGTASERGYGARWQRARAWYLKQYPLCAECQRQRKVVAATVVDHIRPHRGDRVLFWDEANWQSLCEQCHNIKTAKEDGGFGRRPPGGMEISGG